MRSCLVAFSFFMLAACSGAKETKSSENPVPSKIAEKPVSQVPQAPLTIAYSDWPGWVAWEIGIQKKWFEEEGVAVEFKWFEYVPSMEAFSARKVDAVTMTNGDALVTGSADAPSVAILLNDYSNGNDMVIARSGIEDVASLKGKKIGVEVGYVSHLLLIQALQQAGLRDRDVTLVNVPTDQTPQLLKSGSVDAVVAWQPNSGQALAEVAGSKAIFTSRDVPGLIYDVLAVNPDSLASRRADWKKVVKVWFRIADYLGKSENLAEASAIMGARVGVVPEKYRELMKGTFFLDMVGNLEHFRDGTTLHSVVHSSEIVDDFQLRNNVYKRRMPYRQYLDDSVVNEVAGLTAHRQGG